MFIRYKKLVVLGLGVALLSASGMNAFAAGVSYMPYVTADMSDASYWCRIQDQKAALGILENTSDQVLADADQIAQINQKIYETEGCHMTDLENVETAVDVTNTVNEITAAAVKELDGYAHSGYYDRYGNEITEEFFAPLIANMIDPGYIDAQTDVVRNVQYGICTNRTNLLSWPSTDSVTDEVGDNDFDYNMLTSVKVNQPLIIKTVSKDGLYYLVQSTSLSGWIPAGDVAVCHDRAEWLSAWKIPDEKKLIVTDSQLMLESSITSPHISERILTMGTILESPGEDEYGERITNRSLYQNYPVWIPVRLEDGTYSKELALISEHKGVSLGYLPLTSRNIVQLALSRLGDVYGWGGMLQSEDCSGYVRDIYACFGIDLPRNTTWQAACPVLKYDSTNLPQEEGTDQLKEQTLDQLPPGTLLYFKGHTMLYLGSVEGRHYVVSATSSIANEDASAGVRIRSMIISSLEDTKRKSGTTWLRNLYLFMIPYRLG